MVHKRVPREIRRRIGASVAERKRKGGLSRVYQMIERMNSADTRRTDMNFPFEEDKSFSKQWGGRVRSIGVSNKGENQRVVIKRIHASDRKNARNPSARYELNKIRDRVRQTNKNNKENFVLKVPIAYPLKEVNDLVLMADASQYPTLDKINVHKNSDKWPKKSRRLLKEIISNGGNEEDFKRACFRVQLSSRMVDYNLIATGFKGGKYVFIPLMDL